MQSPPVVLKNNSLASVPDFRGPNTQIVIHLTSIHWQSAISPLVISMHQTLQSHPLSRTCDYVLQFYGHHNDN